MSNLDIQPPSQAVYDAMPLLSYTQFFDPTPSRSINRMLSGVMPSAIYQEFYVEPASGLNVLIRAAGGTSLVATKTGELVNISGQHDITITVSANATTYIWLKSNYALNVVTTQSSVNSSIEPAEIVKTSTNVAPESSILLAKVTVPNGATSITAGMLDFTDVKRFSWTTDTWRPISESFTSFSTTVSASANVARQLYEMVIAKASKAVNETITGLWTFTQSVIAPSYKSKNANNNNIAGGLLYRVNNTTDNEHKVCSDKNAIRNFLAVKTQAENDLRYPLKNHTHDYKQSLGSSSYYSGLTSLVNIRPSTHGTHPDIQVFNCSGGTLRIYGDEFKKGETIVIKNMAPTGVLNLQNNGGIIRTGAGDIAANANATLNLNGVLELQAIDNSGNFALTPPNDFQDDGKVLSLDKFYKSGGGSLLFKDLVTGNARNRVVAHDILLNQTETILNVSGKGVITYLNLYQRYGGQKAEVTLILDGQTVTSDDDTGGGVIFSHTGSNTGSHLSALAIFEQSLVVKVRGIADYNQSDCGTLNLHYVM